MNKISCASQNTKAKTLPADISVFGRLGGFYPLLSTQLTADLTWKCSDGFMFHPLSHTV